VTTPSREDALRVAARHWPALAVASACAGIALAVWIAVPLWAALVAAIVAAVVGTILDGSRRVLALALAGAALGLGWGSLRMDALDHSVLLAALDRRGEAELVTVAPARSSAYSVRVIAETRRFRGRAVHERVLLKLPVGRSPPRGALLDAQVRVAEPSPPKDGFDERAWLARQGMHVVLRASDWHQVGRRGGILGLGDRLRDRVERAVGRGTSGVRRAVVLGVVLGEDEDLSASARSDFRASGLYHLLSVSKEARTRLRVKRETLAHSGLLSPGRTSLKPAHTLGALRALEAAKGR
jgi:predicted membrane metal-binding protein